jgi:hypothetical protein
MEDGMKLVVLIVMSLFIATLTGCTTAGPFVTNISSDGRGGLNIEKAKVKFNSFSGVISTTEETTTNIQLFNPNGK